MASSETGATVAEDGTVTIPEVQIVGEIENSDAARAQASPPPVQPTIPRVESQSVFADARDDLLEIAETSDNNLEKGIAYMLAFFMGGTTVPEESAKLVANAPSNGELTGQHAARASAVLDAGGEYAEEEALIEGLKAVKSGADATTGMLIVAAPAGAASRAADPRGSSPIRIPLKVKPQHQQKTGYTQIRYRWADKNGVKYEARWHTRTPGAPAEQGDSWVVTRTTPGNNQGARRSQHILTGKNEWTSMHDWQAAIQARKAGTASAAQQALLKSGHWSVD